MKSPSMTHIFERGCGFYLFSSPFESDILSVFPENEAIHGLTPLCGAKVFVKAKEEEKHNQQELHKNIFSYLRLLKVLFQQ